MATEVLTLSFVETLLDYLGNPDDGNVYRLEQADPTRKSLREEAEKLQAQLAATVARFDAHLLVTGEVQVSAWLDGRTGEPRATLEVRADTVRFLGKREAHQPVATGSAPAADVQPAGLDTAAAEVAF